MRGTARLGILGVVALLLTVMATAMSPRAAAGERFKIGYIIPDATDNWWMREWEGAQKAADKYGFDLIKTEGNDADKILAIIDNYKSQGVQGLLFATPDTRLGPAIVRKCKADGILLLSCANQFENAEGKIMKEVHFSGLAAYDIGKQAGKAMLDEAKRRGWKWEETGLMAMTIEELATAMERMGGAMDVLAEGGFPRENMYMAPIRSWDAIGSFNAADVVLTQHTGIKNWFVTASNDPIVVGAIRAIEGRNIKPENTLGVGINGGEEAKIEFEKAQPTGFFGSIYISGVDHGFHAAESMYFWLKDGKEAPLDYRMNGTLVTRDNFKEYMK